MKTPWPVFSRTRGYSWSFWTVRTWSRDVFFCLFVVCCYLGVGPIVPVSDNGEQVNGYLLLSDVSLLWLFSVWLFTRSTFTASKIIRNHQKSSRNRRVIVLALWLITRRIAHRKLSRNHQEIINNHQNHQTLKRNNENHQEIINNHQNHRKFSRNY